MSQSSVKKVKNSWHRARNFHKKKNAEGVLTKSFSPGPTLKSWAKEQVKNSGPHAEECSQWLQNKKTLAQQSRKQK